MLRSLIRYPATVTGAACGLVLTGIFWASGALWPTELPDHVHSGRQLTGMALMLIALPSYLLVASFVTRRRSLDLLEQLRPLLPEPRQADTAQQAIRDGLKRTWLPGSVCGLGMGLLNTAPMHTLFESSIPSIDISMFFGQLFLWLIVGLLLGQRMVATRSFNRIGEVVELDLFRVDRLRPLAHSGMADVLVIAGALMLTPLQSLDASFRWYNYSFALMIAIPAAVVLLVWPLRSVHRRLRREKQLQLARIDTLIQRADRSVTEEHVLRLETLLAHRARLLAQRTWPLSAALMSRVLVYLVVPPVAWAAAAVVEMIVTRLIGS